jgi:hypothetical protein
LDLQTYLVRRGFRAFLTNSLAPDCSCASARTCKREIKRTIDSRAAVERARLSLAWKIGLFTVTTELTCASLSFWTGDGAMIARVVPDGKLRHSEPEPRMALTHNESGIEAV